MTVDDSALGLTRIIENIDRIRQHVQGYDQEAYVRNIKTKDAVERCLHRIADATYRLGNSFDGRHPQVAWQGIRELRDLLGHDDQTTVDAAVWRTVVSDLPPLEEACHAELKRLSVSFS